MENTNISITDIRKMGKNKKQVHLYVLLWNGVVVSKRAKDSVSFLIHQNRAKSITDIKHTSSVNGEWNSTFISPGICPIKWQQQYKRNRLSDVLNKISHKDLYIMAISMEELGEKEPGMNTGQLLWHNNRMQWQRRRTDQYVYRTWSCNN